MINLTDEMVSRLDSALADGYSCLVGTASKDGEPQISPKGSVMAFDRATLAYWERAKRSALDNVVENPQVVVYYAHAADRVRWRFHGKATVHEDGPIRQEVMDRCVQAELDRDPERLGVADLIKIDKITALSGAVPQQRDQSKAQLPEHGLNLRLVANHQELAGPINLHNHWQLRPWQGEGTTFLT